MCYLTYTFQDANDIENRLEFLFGILGGLKVNASSPSVQYCEAIVKGILLLSKALNEEKEDETYFETNFTVTKLTSASPLNKLFKILSTWKNDFRVSSMGMLLLEKLLDCSSTLIKPYHSAELFDLVLARPYAEFGGQILTLNLRVIAKAINCAQVHILPFVVRLVKYLRKADETSIKKDQFRTYLWAQSLCTCLEEAGDDLNAIEGFS